jgi:cellobiose phosphorylase
LGRGEKAFEAWKRSSFLTRGKEPDIYKVEPYVYSEYSYGPESSRFGEGSYSWMTGSAAWFFRACTDYILGVRPTINGLLVDPCVPKVWEEFSITRNFRGGNYEIHFTNKEKVNKGVKMIKVDGKEVKGNLLPIKTGEVKVEVEMGK